LKLKSKVKHVICGLGVGEHFRYWGYDSSMVHELDWHDNIQLENDFSITATPARHFSGRGLKRNMSLWVSFAIKTKNHNLYIGGDSGYDTHFKEIGEKYGPFDLAVLECGQYDKSWKYIHMMPEEVVQAGFNLKASKVIPVHWSKFSLGNHPWDEPIIRYTTEAEKLKQTYFAPFIGEKINVNDSVTYKSNYWVSIK
jgi:L-ascorbate metabolism protein UlaG (beta-lactamase superfamily)